MLDSLLDPVLSPLLRLGSLWAIIILALGITLIITLCYKYLTDQDEMKRLKKKLKDSQKKMKKLQKDDPKKALAMQKSAMELNMKYMKHSFKPTLYTFIPIIIIFGWMNANLAFLPIMPGEDFTVTATMVEGLPGNVILTSIPELYIEEPVKPASEEVIWNLRAQKGEYDLVVEYGDKTFHKSLLVSDSKYVAPTQASEGSVEKITLGMTEVKPLNGFSIFGWEPGWLGTYIILSIVLSLGMRKGLGIS